MESDSAISMSPTTPSTTPPPPSAFPASGAPSSAAAANGETKELEEYETASDPEIEDSDATALTEETLSPKKSASTLSPAMGDQNPVSDDEGEVHGSDQERLLGVSSDSAENSKDMVLGVGEKKEEESTNPIVGDDSSGGEDAESNRIEKDENLELKEAEEYGSNDTAVEPSPVNVESKGIETSESGVPNSAASLNQSSFEEVEPRNVEAESTAVSTREVSAAGSADTEEGVGKALEEEKKSVNPEEVVPTDSAASFNQTVSKEVEPKGIYTESIAVETGEAGAAGEADTRERFGVALEEEESVSPEEVVPTDSAALLNQSASQEVEPKGADAESVTVSSNEVGDAGGADTQEGFGASIGEENSVNPDEVVPTNGDTLEHNIVVATETDVDGADKAEPPVADVNTGESINAGDELGAVVEDERKSVNLEEVGAIGEADHDLSIGAENSLNNEAPGMNSIESKAETVVAEKGEGLIESPAPVDSEVSKNTADKLDQVNYSEICERSASLNQEFSDEKVVVGSEHASTLGKGEHAHQLAADDEQVETLHVIEKNVVVDENAKEGAAESLPQISDLDQKPDADESLAAAADVEKEEVDEDEDEDEDGRTSNRPARVAILDSTEAAKQIIKEMERISSSFHTGLQGNADGQIFSDSGEAVDSDEDGDGEELFDSAALTALLKAATGASDGTVTVNSQDTARIFSVDRPAGLGSSVPSMRPAAPRSIRPSLYSPSEPAAVGEPDQSMNDDEKKLHEKVEQIRVKFLRLVQRLGQSPDDTVAAQVLYRLGLAEGIRRGRQVSHGFSIETAKKQAQKLEEEGKVDLDFSCNILVLGKTGVGKSATINTIFGEERSHTDPFQLATTSVREISGMVDGVRIRIIDTPGLKASIMDQATNRKILASIKKYTKKCPPDIVLYVDRMDTQTRDFNDLPLLRSIASTLGSSIWFNAIVALTHAASAPPDGPNGSPLGYEVFIAQRSHVVQQSVRQAAGDMRLMNPVALVENHPSCRRNREGERVLPNGLSWKLQLLLLCYSSKILSEANSLLKLQDPSPGKLFGFRLRSPPLPFLLSSLLQSRAHPKLSGDQGGDNADSDIDLDDLSDVEQDEEDDEYDQLPPFKPLRKSQIDKLSKEQRKSYFDEYDYRVKLLQKKQWKEELRRLKEIKKKGNNKPDDQTYGDMPEDYDQDGGPAAVQVPLPDMVLPPSFDCDNPVYRYRFLEPTSQLLTRPVLDAHGWDHDCGYDGVSIEESLAIAGRFPTSLTVQITKDKKEFNIHLDSSVAAKHGENGSTFAGFDIQSVGKQLAYILRGETKFKHLKNNKTAAGISVTFLGDTIATGLKVEDRVSVGKRLGLVASTGAVRAQGEVAFGANLEARLRDKDYPFGQGLSTLGLSLMKWRGDLALGANLQSQFSVGRNSKMAVRLGLNNKLTGQVTVRTTTSEQLQIALAGILPLAVSIYRNIRSNDSYLDH